jgi:hypothetical protein
MWSARSASQWARSRYYLNTAHPSGNPSNSYQSLLLVAVPTSVVEPLKLIAVAIAGEGHWITGTIMIVAAYATRLLLLERLFLIVKPKLMTLNWFARPWTWLTSLRVVRWLKGAKSALGAGGAEPV